MALSSDLICYYKANDNANDTPNGTYNLTWSGAAAYAAAIFDDGFDFNAANHVYRDGDNIPNLDNTSALSISLWFRCDNDEQFKGICSKDEPLQRSWHIVQTGLTVDKSVQFKIFANANGGGNTYTIRGDAPLISGNWYHIVGTWNGTVAKLWINGVSQTNIIDNSHSGNISDSTSRLFAGTYYDSSYRVNGLVDELAIWSRVISDDEIAELYNSGTGKEISFFPNIRLNLADSWKDCPSGKINIGDSWKDLTSDIRVNIGGAWKQLV